LTLCVLSDLCGAGFPLWFKSAVLRRDFVADSRYRFFNVFPITESTEAKISFTGGAKA
jgi:hypothetical protein